MKTLPEILPPHSTLHRQRTRATALMAAIMMLVLIGAAVDAMMLSFTTQIRRTRVAATAPQLRQLLLAGAQLARTDLQQNGNAPRDIPLQSPLPNATTTLHITPTNPNEAAIRILATLNDAHASQLLTLVRGNDNTWTIATAILH